jgi:1-acyl-sn-glycerol-3-phosphate acyltransferase
LIIWSKTLFLMLFWPIPLAIIRLFDRDPVLYRTGLFFRKLGRAMTKANSSWKLRISGETVLDPRHPYVVVSNHQSMADIPLISNLPWEMKWMAKEELFKLPYIGWMLKLAGDICVDRKDARSGVQALQKARSYLKEKCSVMIFPEGTRTLDGRVRQFTDGAFHLAVTSKVPILPIAIDGTFNCIPKNTWKFGKPSEILLKVLPPIDTATLTKQDIPALREKVRAAIIQQLADWRSVPREAVDGLATVADSLSSIFPDEEPTEISLNH